MPEGGDLIEVGDVAFPVVVFRNVYIFPGIPEAVRRKFARIRERFREEPFVLRRIFLRCDEGQIAGELQGAVSRFPELQLGSYPILHNADHNVELTLESKSAAYVEQALRFLLDRLPPQALVRIV